MSLKALSAIGTLISSSAQAKVSFLDGVQSSIDDRQAEGSPSPYITLRCRRDVKLHERRKEAEGSSASFPNVVTETEEGLMYVWLGPESYECWGERGACMTQ